MAKLPKGGYCHFCFRFIPLTRMGTRHIFQAHLDRDERDCPGTGLIMEKEPEILCRQRRLRNPADSE